MIVLDTTVLVYAVGGEHRFRDPTRLLVEAIAARRTRATTTVEAIQQFAHVRARRRGRHDAQRLATAYVDLLSPLLTTPEADVRAGLEVWSNNPAIGAFDAVLATTARNAGASVVVSADHGFAGVEGSGM